MSSGYAVTPIENCPHSESHLPPSVKTYNLFFSPCVSCNDSSENWICLHCYQICCSSYVNGHMKSHSNDSGHSTCLSLIDLSVWCYECDSYIINEDLSALVQELSELKHPSDGSKIVRIPENTNVMDIDGESIRVEELQKELLAAKNARVIDGMYAVTPKDDCPHVNLDNLAANYEIFNDIKIDSQCTDCENTNENWVCLKCGIVKCSRYVKEHMLMHALETSHALALSFSDLSFWCYHCESYIVDLDLTQIYKMFGEKKFGPPRPNQYNSTAHVTEEEKKEYFDTEEELEEKIETLARWVQESKYCIAFTGAGISTSAGIPDYRSGFNTVLPTGAGCWERKANQAKNPPKASVRKSILKALPTPTHMALLGLMNSGYLKHVLSQNVDGLHRKSGIPTDQLSELHGNANVEKCKKCGMEYMRDYGVRNNPHVHMHETGNSCDNPECRGDLIDTIVNFGENLDQKVLQDCLENSQKADLCIAMGSSLRVNPAALFPKEVAKHGKLVIVNLQKTPLDKHALCIHALCDTVVERLMQKLGLDIEEFRLRRRIGISNNGKVVKVRGLDFNGAPYSILTKVVFGFAEPVTVTKEPFEVKLKNGLENIRLSFQGHYGETDLEIKINVDEIRDSEKILEIVFNPFIGEWQ